MKNEATAVVCLLIVALMLLASISANAEKVLMKDQNGTVKEMEPPAIWTQLTAEETSARTNPGKEIPAGPCLSVSCRRVDFFHIVKIRQYGKVIVFNNNRLQTIDKKVDIEDESEIFCFLVVFCLIGVCCMVFSNLSAIIKGCSTDITLFVTLIACACVATFLAFLATFNSFFSPFIFLGTVFALLFIFYAAIAIIGDTASVAKKTYVVCSVLFYITIALVLFL